MGPVGQWTLQACLWEVTARKPGNVHREADFADLTYLDFALSAGMIAPVLDAAPVQSIGETIAAAVEATRQVAASNTNLGMILLLAPLASVPLNEPLRLGLVRRLSTLSVRDASLSYAAIRRAQPGGLGQVDQADVAEEPTCTLLEAMQLAAERDQIARQYAHSYQDIFTFGLAALQAGITRHHALEPAIIHCQLSWLATFPDSLIARKLGPAIAAEAMQRAQQAQEGGTAAIADFDVWLRADGHRRNPGTTADLVAATLFVALRTGMKLPERWTG